MVVVSLVLCKCLSCPSLTTAVLIMFLLLRTLHNRHAKLWRYNVKSGQWAFMGGNTGTNLVALYPSTIGVEGATYYPGSRDGCLLTIDHDNNNVWLYAGHIMSSKTYNVMSDLWRWRPSTGQWYTHPSLSTCAANHAIQLSSDFRCCYVYSVV